MEENFSLLRDTPKGPPKPYEGAKNVGWNCNGIILHYEYLKLLLTEHNPICVCIQESHLKPGQPYSLRGYQISRRDIAPDLRAHGGVLTMIRNDIQFENVDIQSRLQVVAIRIKAPVLLSICNIYLPQDNWQENDITHIIEQLPTPFLLLGDFNAHNPLWGSELLSNRGRIVEQILENDQVAILNTGSPTYFNMRSRKFSSIDLSLTSSNLLYQLEWAPLNDLHGSDHFPIIINDNNNDRPLNLPTKWITAGANWESIQILY
ncbi:hypothetical protein JTB14_002287 [Gonioctena quinquepunctata]|nr:hypothetical protein JTB14_002287 [Gonioctena quinquepunctata]